MKYLDNTYICISRRRFNAGRTLSFNSCFRLLNDQKDESGKPDLSAPILEEEEVNDEKKDADEEVVIEEKSLAKQTIPENIDEVVCVPVFRKPLFPGHPRTINIKDQAVSAEITRLLKSRQPYIGIFLAKDDATDIDKIDKLDDIYRVGVFASVVHVLTSPDKSLTMVVDPHRRIRATSLTESDDGVSRVKVMNVKEEPFEKGNQLVRALSQEIFAVLSEIVKMNSFFREQIIHLNITANVFEEPAKLADFISFLTSSSASEQQEVLESIVVEERLRKALVLLKKELASANLQSAISKDVDQKIAQKHREFFLHEQLRSIKKELGLESDGKEKVLEAFRAKAAELKMPDAAKKVFDEELQKLSVLEQASSEYNVSRNYIDWLTQIPWGKQSNENFDFKHAKTILEEDHHGLEDVKDRILEFIAVGKLRGSVQGKIICLAGPPGVGKTSVGKSIARALGREFFRFSVGGLSDVAEIKGHRRTYVGAMPGKIIQALKKVQTENPLVLIDEIDKIGSGNQGDPSSALLEMLDPEQNNSFLDHYMDVSVDLSKVLFVCTANEIGKIPGPLLDRMEVINVSGYVLQEKIEIAKKYLIPSAVENSGLSLEKVKIDDAAIELLIKSYCRESGVRSLKKMVEKILRKAALKIVKEEEEKCEISESNLSKYVGQPIFTSDRIYEKPPPGVVMGLAWTGYGGSVLYIESIIEATLKKDGKPSLMSTGQLGDVMKESTNIAYSFAKSFLSRIQPENEYFEHAAIHLHVPEGATPKDGPSAGVTMTSSLLSLALGKPLKDDIAMTGELTLTGKVLKIGGLKEKVIAAKRCGIKHIICPKANTSDWEELPEYIKEGVDVHLVDKYEEIFDFIF